MFEQQKKLIVRMYNAVEPELAEMEERAGAARKEHADDQRLKLETLWESYESEAVKTAQFSPVEDSVAAITKDGTVAFFSSKGAKLRQLSLPDQQVSALALAANGQQALAGTTDGKVVLWDLATGKSRTILGRR